MNVYGELTRAQLENLSADPSLAAATAGRLWYRTDLTVPKIDLGGSADTLALLALAQTFTNKTFGDPITFTQIATPSTPTSGFNKLYPKSDGNFYSLNSLGIEAQIGAGAGGGSKNYLGTVNNVNGNGSFELGAITGWSLAHSTLSTLIPTSVASAGTAFSSSSGGTAATSLGIAVVTTAALTPTATWISGNDFITVSLATGIVQGQIVTNPGSGSGFPAAPVFVTNISGTSIYLNKALTGTQASASNMQFAATPLAGAYSLAFGTSSQTGPTSSTAGDLLISNAFTIDAEDKAKMLTVKFYFQNQSGTALNFSGSSSNSFALWIYDVTNAAWIQPAGVYNLTQGSGIGYCTASFQTTSNSTQYQLALININATSSTSYNLWLDDFSLGPQTAPIGPAMSDWVPYIATISGFGTVSASAFYSRRVGDTLEVDGSFLTGTPAASQVQIGLGYNGIASNVTIDTTKVGSGVIVGVGGLGATTLNSMNVLATASTYVNIGYNTSGGSSNQLAAINGSSVTGSSGVAIHIFFRVPIVGWSSNVSMSNDTDTRYVAARASTAATSISGTPSVAVNGTVTYDTHGAYNSSTGIFTVPVSGKYRITGQARTSNVAWTAGNVLETYLYKNGSQYSILSRAVVQTNGTYTLQAGGTDEISCIAGDTLAFYVYSDVATTLGAGTGNFFTAERLSGPAVIAATESVNMGYTDTAGGSVTGTAGVYTFATKVFDSHAAYTGGLYTVQVSGKYRVSVNVQVAATSLSTSQAFQAYIFQNTTQKAAQAVFGNGTSQAYSLFCGVTLQCVAGDTISVKLQSTTSTTLNTTAGVNNLNIERIGN